MRQPHSTNSTPPTGTQTRTSLDFGIHLRHLGAIFLLPVDTRAQRSSSTQNPPVDKFTDCGSRASRHAAQIVASSTINPSLRHVRTLHHGSSGVNQFQHNRGNLKTGDLFTLFAPGRPVDIGASPQRGSVHTSSHESIHSLVVHAIGSYHNRDL
jgi:hypothetical protein